MLDAAYSPDTMRTRSQTSLVTSRDLDGFFEHVWTVHPAVGASPEHVSAPCIGPPTSTPLAFRHTLVEGKVGRFHRLQRFPRLNFTLAQVGVVLHLHRLVRSEGVSLVGAIDPQYLGLLGLLLARLNRVPFMITIVANYDAIYNDVGLPAYPRLLRHRSIEKRIEHLVLSSADLVALGSEDNRRYALDNGARPQRIRMFRFGELIDPVHFVDPRDRPSVREELGLGSRPWMLTVSRLSPVKRPEDVLYTLAHARRTVPSLMAVIVGDGPMRPELEALARQLGVEDSLVLAGNRSQSWVARALASATVILSPLTGRALVEAALSGTPIVAYDYEWQSEFITSGDNGVLVRYRDVKAMADAVGRLIAEPAYAAALGACARARTLETWDPAENRAAKVQELSKLLQLGHKIAATSEPRAS